MEILSNVFSTESVRANLLHILCTLAAVALTVSPGFFVMSQKVLEAYLVVS